MKHNSQQREKLFSLTFILIIVCNFAAFFIGQSFNSGTTVFLERTGVESVSTIAGIGTATFFAAASISRIFAGRLADAWRRKNVILLGFTMSIIGSIGPMLGNAIGLFILWRALQGLGYAFVTTGAGTAAADSVPQSRLSEGIGYAGLGQGLAMAVGPACALFLVGTDPATNMFVGLLIASIAALILALQIRYEKNPSVLPEQSAYRLRMESEKQESTSVEDRQQSEQGEQKTHGIIGWFKNAFVPQALPGAVPAMLISWLFSFGITFIGLYGTQLGVVNAGLFFTTAAISIISVRLLSGMFMNRFRPITLTTFSVCCGILAVSNLMLCSVISNDGILNVMFVLGGIPYGIASGVAYPVAHSMAVRLSPEDRWGSATGTYEMLGDANGFIACILLGVISDAFGLTFAMGLVICILILAAVLARILYPNEKVGQATS